MYTTNAQTSNTIITTTTSSVRTGLLSPGGLYIWASCESITAKENIYYRLLHLLDQCCEMKNKTLQGLQNVCHPIYFSYEIKDYFPESANLGIVNIFISLVHAAASLDKIT